jgi:DnaJ-class molecular chaperone
MSASHLEPTNCKRCKGSGKARQGHCVTCQGSGRVFVQPAEGGGVLVIPAPKKGAA